ncbi:MAG: TRAP transporter substrate-binding protein DctP [Burkholderiaceae bacterium]
MKLFSRVAATLVAAGLAGAASPVLAMDTITATHAFPKSLIYSRSFLEMVDKANKAGAGVFEIKVRGGPEAIPMMQQPNAARNGVVDMVHVPCAFYSGTVPECDVVSAASVDAATARANGGLALLSKAHEKRMDTIALGWVDSGVKFHLWSVREPKLDSSGALDVSGFKVRGNAIYNAFFTNYLKAQVINVNMPDIYTALERGTVELMGWTQIGLMDPNWDRFLKYRLDPAFFSTDVMVIMNKKKWDSLSPKSREILTQVVAEHEKSSTADRQALWVKEEAELTKRGIKVVAQSPEAGAKFTAAAVAENIKRMRERLEKAGGENDADALIEKFVGK